MRVDQAIAAAKQTAVPVAKTQIIVAAAEVFVRIILVVFSCAL